MVFAQWQFWPVWFICGGMIASAIIDWWKFKVPNKLTFPLILSGWALGLAHTVLANFPSLCPEALQGGVGGIGASLAGTALGFFLLWPVYAVGGMGAGDVKMTMGFGSWIGAFFGFEHNCLGIIFYSFCAGVIIGGVIGLGMILVRGQFQKNVGHTREIIRDLFTLGVGDAAARANQRRSRWHRLPYGVPLCIGFVGCLVYLFLGTPVQPVKATSAVQNAQPAPMHQTIQVAGIHQL